MGTPETLGVVGMLGASGTEEEWNVRNARDSGGKLGMLVTSGTMRTLGTPTSSGNARNVGMQEILIAIKIVYLFK